MYRVECYFDMKKEGILPFAIMWMDFESIMLSEINQTEKDNYYLIETYTWSKKTEPMEIEFRFVIAGGGDSGVGQLDKGGQKVQLSSYKINKFWGGNTQHGDYS